MRTPAAVAVCLLLPCAAALASCGGDEPETAPPEVRGITRAVSSTTAKCTLARLPGTDPAKPLSIPCAKPVLKTPSAALLAKQQQYLAAWQSQSAAWSKLSAAEREAKRAALKASILGN